MSVFVPRKISKDESYSWRQMAKKTGTVFVPPLDEEQERTTQDVENILIQDQFVTQVETYKFKVFPANTAEIEYPTNPTDTEYDVSPYGRYGWRCSRLNAPINGRWRFYIPFWYDAALPDVMMYIQLGVQIQDRGISGNWTLYDSIAGTIDQQPGHRPDWAQSNFNVAYSCEGPQITSSSIAMGRNSFIGIMPVPVIRSTLTPGLNKIEININIGNQPRNFFFHMYNTVLPQVVTFGQKNGNPQEGWSPTMFRLADSDSVGWNLNIIGTVYNPLDLYEQSEDKDNLHAYVKRNNHATPGITPWTVKASHFTQLPWPCTVSGMGSGYVTFVDSLTDATQESTGTNGSARFDGWNTRWQQGNFWPGPNTVGFTARVTSGNGYIFSAITYMCFTTELDAGDRDLEQYKRNNVPDTRWQQGLGACDWRTFNGTLQDAALYNASPSQWVQP
jgi:hypothetical protein